MGRKPGSKNKQKYILNSERYVTFKKEVDLVHEERERRFLD